jgi:hypothetical protein
VAHFLGRAVRVAGGAVPRSRGTDGLCSLILCTVVMMDSGAWPEAARRHPDETQFAANLQAHFFPQSQASVKQAIWSNIFEYNGVVR